VEPDSDLSDADWKETLLTVTNVNGNSMHPDALNQAITDHSDKESDDVADLIRNAADEGYLRTTVNMNWTSTSKLKGAVDAQTQDESG
jgi:molybdenum cofactor biosynthesis enzyme MoaA